MAFKDFTITQINELVDAMNANQKAGRDRGVPSPYQGVELTELRRKYALVNYVMTNGQRTACFLVDQDWNVYQAKAYGVRGRFVGSLLTVTAQFTRATDLLTGVSR